MGQVYGGVKKAPKKPFRQINSIYSFMKKFFGIVLLIAAMFLTGVGVAIITEAEAKSNSYEGQLRSEFSSAYQRRNDEAQAAGGIVMLLSVVCFISGIILCVSKSKKQREKEFELELLQKANLLGLSDQKDVYGKIEKLGDLKQQGLLTEDEFNFHKLKLLNFK